MWPLNTSRYYDSEKLGTVLPKCFSKVENWWPCVIDFVCDALLQLFKIWRLVVSLDGSVIVYSDKEYTGVANRTGICKSYGRLQPTSVIGDCFSLNEVVLLPSKLDSQGLVF